MHLNRFYCFSSNTHKFSWSHVESSLLLSALPRSIINLPSCDLDVLKMAPFRDSRVPGETHREPRADSRARAETHSVDHCWSCWYPRKRAVSPYVARTPIDRCCVLGLLMDVTHVLLRLKTGNIVRKYHVMMLIKYILFQLLDDLRSIKESILSK